MYFTERKYLVYAFWLGSHDPDVVVGYGIRLVTFIPTTVG